MSKPIPTTAPMFRMIEKQLMDAMHADDMFDPQLATPLGLGSKSAGVLAEILGAAHAAAGYNGSAHAYADEIECLKHDLERAQAIGAAEATEVGRLFAIINTPESDDFLKGVSIEAEFQRQKHGEHEGDVADYHQNFYWVAAHLLGKALWSLVRGNADKGRHHLVTSAALIFNWHNAISGKPAAAARNETGKQFADSL